MCDCNVVIPGEPGLKLMCGQRTLIFVHRHVLQILGRWLLPSASGRMSVADRRKQTLVHGRALMNAAFEWGGAVYPVQLYCALQRAIGHIAHIELHSPSAPKRILKRRTTHLTFGSPPPKRQKIEGAKSHRYDGDAWIDMLEVVQERSYTQVHISPSEIKAEHARIHHLESKLASHQLGTADLVRLLPVQTPSPSQPPADAKSASIKCIPTDGAPGTVVILLVDARALPYTRPENKNEKRYMGHYIVLHSYDPKTDRVEVYDSAEGIHHITVRQLAYARQRTALQDRAAAIVVRPLHSIAHRTRGQR